MTAGGKAERVQASFPTNLAEPARINIRLFSFNHHPAVARNWIPRKDFFRAHRHSRVLHLQANRRGKCLQKKRERETGKKDKTSYLLQLKICVYWLNWIHPCHGTKCENINRFYQFKRKICTLEKQTNKQTDKKHFYISNISYSPLTTWPNFV